MILVVLISDLGCVRRLAANLGALLQRIDRGGGLRTADRGREGGNQKYRAQPGSHVHLVR